MKHCPVFVLTACCCGILIAACGTGDSVEDRRPDLRLPGNSQAVSLTYTEQRDACADRNPYRNLYFGDLHAHTTASFDAYGYDVRLGVEDAYAFARGEEVLLPPLDETGRGTRPQRLSRPLDFAMVSDHSEYFGEVHLCREAGSPVYDSDTCQKLRQGGTAIVAKFGMRYTHTTPSRFKDICGEDGSGCADAIKEVWQHLIGAAQDVYDRSDACDFTAFIGYEYTSTLSAANLHRNVLFRNDEVIDAPVSYFEAPRPEQLWQKLDEQCLAAGFGCDVLSIPHNSNWSNGTLFFPRYGEDDDPAEQRRIAALRAKLEPVAEIFQHKGDMECMNGLSGTGGDFDPFCNNEKIRFDDPVDDCGDDTGAGGVSDIGCISRYDFLRNVLKSGLREQQRLGINPFRLGFIGSTDTHNAIPGGTEEATFLGHVGISDAAAEDILGDGNATHRGIVNNPGGLAAVWAVENSRDAIFEALQRREVYGTSGTRITLRFYGADDFDEAICRRADLVKRGHDRGVPMGGDLSGLSAAPVFVAAADMDPGTEELPGSPLERMQMVKGWVDAGGNLREKVYHLAGDSEAVADADDTTCLTTGDGYEHLCARWQDPDFDPAIPAVYYLRVLETPVCRWSTPLCNSFDDDERPPRCADPNIRRIVQERAWSSAIWYQPAGE